MPAYQHLSKQMLPKDTHHFAARPEGSPLSYTPATAKSSQVNWKSSETHRPGGLAGLSSMNRQTLVNMDA